MFIGEYHHNLDSKGRLIIPVKFREEFQDKIIATKGLDGCLALYTQEQWLALYNTLKKLPATKMETRRYIRLITAKATECEFDSLGRILIPATLASEAKLEKSCVVVGAGDHAEIWSEENWAAYSDEASAAFEESAEELTEYMFKDETL